MVIPAGKEDPVELDSSLILENDFEGVVVRGSFTATMKYLYL